MSFPRFSLSASTFPRFVLSASSFPQFTKLVSVEEPLLSEFPPHIDIPEKKADYDYDYEDLSYYDIIRDRLTELKLEWPLTEEDERQIMERTVNGNPETQLIKNAFLQADSEQKQAILDITDKLKYTL